MDLQLSRLGYGDLFYFMWVVMVRFYGIIYLRCWNMQVVKKNVMDSV